MPRRGADESLGVVIERVEVREGGELLSEKVKEEVEVRRRITEGYQELEGDDAGGRVTTLGGKAEEVVGEQKSDEVGDQRER